MQSVHYSERPGGTSLSVAKGVVSTLNSQLSTLNSQLSTLNSQLSTLYHGLVTNQPTRQRRGSVAVVVRDGRFLLIRRSQYVVAPGRYCFPGGGIEPGESEEQALVREIAEAARYGDSASATIMGERDALGNLVGLVARRVRRRPAAPNAAEVESVAWVTAEEMAALPDLLESNQAFLEALAAGVIKLDGRGADGSTEWDASASRRGSGG